MSNKKNPLEMLLEEKNPSFEDTKKVIFESAKMQIPIGDYEKQFYDLVDNSTMNSKQLLHIKESLETAANYLDNQQKSFIAKQYRGIATYVFQESILRKNQ